MLQITWRWSLLQSCAWWPAASGRASAEKHLWTTGLDVRPGRSQSCWVPAVSAGCAQQVILWMYKYRLYHRHHPHHHLFYINYPFWLYSHGRGYGVHNSCDFSFLSIFWQEIEAKVGRYICGWALAFSDFAVRSLRLGIGRLRVGVDLLVDVTAHFFYFATAEEEVMWWH